MARQKRSYHTVTDDEIKRMVEMRQKSYGMVRISKETGVPFPSVVRHLKTQAVGRGVLSAHFQVPKRSSREELD